MPCWWRSQASRVRNARTCVFNAGQNVVLNFQLKLSSVQETITVAGDAPIVQTTSSEVSSTIDQTAFQNLPVKERNYFRLLTLDSNVVATGTGSNAVNVGGEEVWNFGTYVDGTNNHSKWLTLQRAPQLGFERLRDRDGQGSAAHHQPVLGRVRRPFRRRGEHDHQDRHQRVQRLGVRDGPAGRPGRGAAAGAGRQRREGQGAVQPAAVRRHRRRPDRPATRRSSSAATSGGASAARSSSPPSRRSGWSCRRRPTSTRATPRSTSASRRRIRWASATTWSAGRRTTRAAGCNLPGTGFLWDNNVDTLHGTFTTVVSDRMLNEVRGQYSRYTDRRAAKCDCVAIQRQGYSTSGGYDQGTWGVLPEETYDISTTMSMWAGNHTMKTGASFTYDVTEQLFQPLQNGRYTFSGSPAVAPNPFQVHAVVRADARSAVDVPEGVRARRLLPGRLARAAQPDAQSRPPLRRRDHQGHPGLAGGHRCQQPRPARRLRVGSEWRSEVGGPRRLRTLHAAARHLHHRQGRRRRPERAGHASI